MDLDLFLILPRIIQSNGLFLFYNILLFVCIYGFLLNTLLIVYGRRKQLRSFIHVVVSIKGNLGILTLSFFVLLCLRKIIFNQILFAKSSLFLHHLLLKSSRYERIWMIAFAAVIFFINLKFIFVKKIKTLFWFNYLVIGIFLYLTFFCLSYFINEFPSYMPQDFSKKVYFYRFNTETMLGTFIILLTLLDKFDFTIDVCNEISEPTK